jgi:hypothetical protein
MSTSNAPAERVVSRYWAPFILTVVVFVLASRSTSRSATGMIAPDGMPPYRPLGRDAGWSHAP